MDDAAGSSAAPSMAADNSSDDVSRLLLRLALIRERIDASYMHVVDLPVVSSSSEDDESAEFAPSILVTQKTHPDWRGEGVLIWHRLNGRDAWAVQSACPHAAISLQMSDIEDFGKDFPTTTKGPCIACPAHMYVFDLGSGRCLTDRLTPDARLYTVRRTGPHQRDSNDDSFYSLWLCREPNEALPDTAAPLSQAEQEELKAGQQIQMKLVAKGLRRKFGDFEEEEEDDDEFAFFNRVA